jgi:hypothetical protein
VLRTCVQSNRQRKKSPRCSQQGTGATLVGAAPNPTPHALISCRLWRKPAGKSQLRKCRLAGRHLIASSHGWRTSGQRAAISPRRQRASQRWHSRAVVSGWWRLTGHEQILVSRPWVKFLGGKWADGGGWRKIDVQTDFSEQKRQVLVKKYVSSWAGEGGGDGPFCPH